MIRNKGKVEGSIVQSHIVDELSNYCSLYLEPTVREPRNFAPNIPCSSSNDPRLSIFKHPSRRLFEKGGKDKVLTQKDRHKAHSYILLNCQELLESVWLFEKELRDSFPNYDEATIDKMKDEEFATWLQMHGNDDDESIFHDAHTRRGHASQVQVPEPINREWIWIEDGEFNNQEKATRIIGVILKAMWNGPWDSWRDVPNEDRTRLFERFQGYFQWEEKWNVPICRHWEKCIAGKFPDFLRKVRNEAKETARKQGLLVGDDMLVLIDFKPPWIRTEIWKKMIDIWNAPKWKAKSQRNTDIKCKSIGGKHTLGSQSYMTAKRKAAKILGRELQPHEMWKQSHCRKGSRPMDKDLSSSSSHVSDVDSEENIEEENLVWVDERAKETWAKYDGYLVEKYGDERSNHPKFDEVLWSRAAGGKNKRKVYGLSCVNDSNEHGRHNPEVC
ncbi:hypothetical protein E3N88_25465 [Mikania micrantha]|uniref:DUF4218 domain-containing protein n=1 Tax=Mikania micrantha TaxID=192012 RepID=A0A5N6N592_9ASTR|nr:hypothetical protein E3N88_25465 [Mikania micrantha]